MFLVFLFFLNIVILDHLFMFVCVVISVLLYYVSNKYYMKKEDSKFKYNKELIFYECGFELFYFKFSFSLQYYIISLSFMLFDLEICLFLPVIYSSSASGFTMYLSIFFIFILLVAFMYELCLSILSW